MREEARRLEEEEVNRLSELENARMKFEEELNYTTFGDDDLDPDSDSRYGHIQSNGSLMVSYRSLLASCSSTILIARTTRSSDN
jgi:hypothetical protein